MWLNNNSQWKRENIIPNNIYQGKRENIIPNNKKEREKILCPNIFFKEKEKILYQIILTVHTHTDTHTYIHTNIQTYPRTLYWEDKSLRSQETARLKTLPCRNYVADGKNRTGERGRTSKFLLCRSATGNSPALGFRNSIQKALDITTSRKYIPYSFFFSRK